jgi:hypothetical protein
LDGEEPQDLRLSWGIGKAARAALEEELFGKHVLITNQNDWSVTEEVAGYLVPVRSRVRIPPAQSTPRDVDLTEDHWTEHNIRVHVFTCVLVHLMRRTAVRAGLHLSVRELLGQLAPSARPCLSTLNRRTPKARRMTTELIGSQQKLCEIFGLARLAPRSYVIRLGRPWRPSDQQRCSADLKIVGSSG